MIAIIIPVNVYMLAGSLVGAVVIGFIFRSKQIKKLRRRVGELEKDLLSNHSDILELQKEKTILEQKLKDNSSSLVIPITSVSTDDSKAEKDRKKMIPQQSAEKH